MKILHIPHAYAPVIGGAERICQQVSTQLARWGHQVTIVTTDVGAVQGYYEFGIARVSPASEVLDEVQVIRLPFCDAWYRLAGWMHHAMFPKVVGKRVASRLVRLLRRRLTRGVGYAIREIAPDVVMTMPHLVTNVLAVLAVKQHQSFPLVMVPMLHEHDPNWNISAMARALEGADAVIAMTSYEIERLVTAYGVAREKIFLGSAGVEVHETPRWDRRARRVVFVGRKTRSKGLAALIEAMTHVWPEMPDAELCLAGIRVPETQEIDVLVGELPMPWRQQVTQLDEVTEEDKAHLFSTAGCVVLPSRTESFGMVILEAWATGTPVVVWDLPVFRSVVTDGEDGLLADPQNPDALAHAILQLLRAPQTAERMGRAGYTKAQQHYSWQVVSRNYLQAYGYATRHTTE